MVADLVRLSPGVLARLTGVGANAAYALDVARAKASGELTTEAFFTFWDALGASSPPDIGLRLAQETATKDYELPRPQPRMSKVSPVKTLPAVVNDMPSSVCPGVASAVRVTLPIWMTSPSGSPGQRVSEAAAGGLTEGPPRCVRRSAC